MSYWISLRDKEDHIPDVDRFDEGGTHQVGGSTEADLNVTYNYAGKFYFRGLHGRAAKDTIPEMEEAVKRLEVGPDDSDDYWQPTDGNVCRAVRTLLMWAKQYPDHKWNVN
jgi:hypothetical protein